MVLKHLPYGHHFVCLTDRPAELSAAIDAANLTYGPECIDILRIPAPKPDVFGWWSKMELFNPYHNMYGNNALSGRMLYLDLDVLIVNDLSPIVDYKAGFALIPDAGTFKPKTHHEVVKRFNSSVMSWTANSAIANYLWWRYTTGGPDYWHNKLWGDQDLIGFVHSFNPDVQAMPIEWFPRLSECQPDSKGMSLSKGARVVLCKKPKNIQAATQWPWFRAVWGD
jgi:hypothetical protein